MSCTTVSLTGQFLGIKHHVGSGSVAPATKEKGKSKRKSEKGKKNGDADNNGSLSPTAEKDDSDNGFSVPERVSCAYNLVVPAVNNKIDTLPKIVSEW